VRFWQNPEFVRYARAELRPVRMVTTGLLVLVICLLLGLICWSSTSDQGRFYSVFYTTLLSVQGGVLSLWCLSSCGQAVVREREMKTYDFLRTTRLTSAELLIGKVLGTPILGYFCFLCSLPVAVSVGLLAGHSVATLLWTYALILVFALFVAVCGLWLSMLVEKMTVSPALVGLLLGGPLLLTGIGVAQSPFPGFAAITPLPALFALYDANGFSQGNVVFQSAPVFGVEMPIVPLTLLLYATFIAWPVLMLLRNLKNERSELRLLSRAQALAFAAYFHLLFCAFLDPLAVGAGGSSGIPAAGVSAVVVLLNGILLFAVALATLTPAEQLRRWWRMRTAGKESYLAAQGPAWPWLIVTAAVGFCFLGATALVFNRSGSLGNWHLGGAAALMLANLVYVIRDASFLQWCMLTRLKQPVVKGSLYLILYYTAAGILASVFSTASGSRETTVLDLLTPFRPFEGESGSFGIRSVLYVGLGLQSIVIVLLWKAISRRLARPATAGSAA